MTEETVVSVTLKVENPVGLHARPAALFVQTAGKFKAAVRVRNLTRGTPFVDAKSILGVMGIGVAQGHEIEVVAEGEDAAAAIAAIQALAEVDFEPPESADDAAGVES